MHTKGKGLRKRAVLAHIPVAVLVILACLLSRAYFGIRLHTSNAWIRFVDHRRLAGSRPTVACWDMLQIAIAGLLTSVLCWLSLLCVGEQLTVSIQAFCITMKMLNSKVP